MLLIGFSASRSNGGLRIDVKKGHFLLNATTKTLGSRLLTARAWEPAGGVQRGESKKLRNSVGRGRVPVSNDCGSPKLLTGKLPHIGDALLR